jgi:nucleoside-diphosphate-sugar epimerase
MPAKPELPEHFRLCIVGCGYTGRELARQAMSADAPVYGLTRSERSLAAMTDAGIPGETLDLDDESLELPEALSRPGIGVAYLIPPGRHSTSDARLAAFLKGLAVKPAAFVYLSTSGVYGHCQGALVDETTPVNPQTERAVRRLAAERMVKEWCTDKGVRWTILRAPGIYGPGRLSLARLKSGEPVLAEADANPGNRIHVVDLAAAILCCFFHASGSSIYNLSDGDHRSSTAFLARVSEIAGLPPPITISREEAKATMSANRWSFLSESRRLDGRKIQQELGFVLRYADLDEGIRASLENRVIARSAATKQSPE